MQRPVPRPRRLVRILVALVAGLAAAEDPPRAIDQAVEPEPLPQGAILRIGSTRMRLSSEATAIGFAPDGRTLASADAEGRLRIWDVRSGAPVWTSNRLPSPAKTLGFSPDAASIATGCQDGSVHLWDARTGQILVTLRETGEPVSSLAFHPTEPVLLTSSESGIVCVWDTIKGERLRVFGTRGEGIQALGVSPDGKAVLTGGADGTVRLRDIQSGEVVRAYDGPSSGVLAVAFSPRGHTVSCACASGQYFGWDRDSGKGLQDFDPDEGGVSAVTMAPDGSLLASRTRDGALLLRDAGSGAEVARAGPFPSGSGPMVFSVDGATLAFACGRTLRLWRARSDPAPLPDDGPHEPIRSMALSPDGKVLVVSDAEGCGVWDLSSGRRTMVLEPGAGTVDVVEFALAGRRIVGGTSDGKIRSWDAVSGRAEETIDACSGAVRALAAARGAALVASSTGRGPVKLWDLASGSLAPPIGDEKGNPVELAFSTDGTLLFCRVESSKIEVWETASGHLVRALGLPKGAGGFDVSPDGKIVAWGASGHGVFLSEVATGGVALALDLDNGQGVSTAPVWSPDGRRLAAPCADGLIRLWDAPSGRATGRLEGNATSESRLAFSADGRLLVSTSVGGSMLVWDLSQAPGSAGREVLSPGPATDPDGRLLGADTVARFASTRFRHAAEVANFSPSPDGKLIASVDVSGQPHVWEAATAMEIASGPAVPAPPNGSPCILFHPDGKRIFLTSEHGIGFWPLASDKERRQGFTFVPAGGISSTWLYDASPDGTVFAVVSSGNLALSDGGEPRYLCTPRGSAATAAAFSPDGRQVAAILSEGFLFLWDATALDREIFSEEAIDYDAAGTVSYSPDGKLLAYGTKEHGVRIWDLSASKEARLLQGHQGKVLSVRFSPDGRSLASSSLDGTLRWWDAGDGHERACHRLALAAKGKLRFLPGTSTVVVPSGSVLVLLNLEAGAPAPAAHSQAPVTTLAISPDVRWVLIGRSDGEVQVADVSVGRVVRCLCRHEKQVLAVACAQEGGGVLSVDAEGTLTLSDVKEGGVVRTWKRGLGPISSASFSPEARWVCARDRGGPTRVWAVPTGEDLGAPVSSVEARGDIAFSLDGRAAGEVGSEMVFWDASTWKELSRTALSGHSSTRAFFDQTGRLLRTGWSGQRWQVNDVVSGALVMEPRDQPRDSKCVGISRSGGLVAWREPEGRTTVTDLTALGGARTIEGHGGEVRTSVFSPAEDLLVTGGEDGVVVVWSLRPVVHAPSGPDGVQAWWDALASGDSRAGQAAVAGLVFSPQSVLDDLRQRLEAEPASPPVEEPRAGEATPRVLRRLRMAQAAEWIGGDPGTGLLESLKASARTAVESSDATAALARSKARKGR